jgi:hypothetical protein
MFITKVSHLPNQASRRVDTAPNPFPNVPLQKIMQQKLLKAVEVIEEISPQSPQSPIVPAFQDMLFHM